MNAIDFLVKEHDKVRKVLAEIKKKTHRFTTRVSMFDDLCADLVRHETMEQKIWYPHFRKNKKLKTEVKHLLSEEAHAEKAIKSFNAVMTEKEWDAKFAKFKKAVEHHAHEEEYKLFPNVEEMLDKTELEKIGKDMRVFKKKYKKK